MSLEKQTITEDYPLPAYNYSVVVNGNEVMSFAEISGLDIEHGHVLYRHGFSWATGIHLIRGQKKPVNVTLKRGVVKRRNDLYDWLQSGKKRDIRIELIDEQRTTIVVWEVTRALPLKLDAPSFSANSSDVALETLELVAHDLRIKHI